MLPFSLLSAEIESIVNSTPSEDLILKHSLAAANVLPASDLTFSTENVGTACVSVTINPAETSCVVVPLGTLATTL